MHPAFSIILFTTLSGFGYGLAAVLGTGVLDPAAAATKAAHVAALVLIAGGLLASTLHLGNPGRAWRALSQWRSSWLSREGVLAILAFLPLTANAVAVLFFDRSLMAAGLIGTVLAGLTVFATAMIYASLRAVQAWNTRLTAVCYLLFALACGLVAATLTAALGGGPARWLALAAVVAVGAAWFAKTRWWRRMDGMTPLSTPESATGLGAIGRVRLFERPHATDNYLTREMGYRVARKHARKLRMIALVAGGAAPAALMGLIALFGIAPAALGLAAVVALAFALVVERWLFFAEAKHAVMNYY